VLNSVETKNFTKMILLLVIINPIRFLILAVW